MEIEIPGIGDGKVDILKSVSTWLMNKDNGPWLLILDNVDDASVLFDLSTNETGTGATPVHRRLLKFLPRVEHGAVLITTRDRTCALKLTGHRSTPIEVLSMTMDESVDLLRNILRDAPQEEATELVKELEYVPLAISQASAYINTVSQASIFTYLSTFRRGNEDQAALLNKNEHDLRRDPDVPNAVITSWELSFNQIREQSPRSADLLSLMSYFNRQAIPQFLIKRGDDDLSFYDDINPLLSFSLIRAEIGEETFEMHRLVQTATQHWLRSQGYDQSWKERAIAGVASSFPRLSDQSQHWAICDALISHADEVILYTTGSMESELSRAKVLAETAWYLSQRKWSNSLAEQRSTSALEIQRQFLDENPVEILLTLNVLAATQDSLSKFKEAMDLRGYILEQYQKLYGFEDVETLIAMHNLARSHESLGQYDQAETLIKHVMELKERTLRTENPSLLASANLLVAIQIKQGKYEEAERLGAEELKKCRGCLGVEHITTLNVMLTLSQAYLRREKPKEAEALVDEAIPLFTKTFGYSHPITLSASNLLAEVYWLQGKLEEAKEICTWCLGTAQEVLGAEHPVTIDIASLLAKVYQGQRRFIDASRILEDVLERYERILGPDHPITLSTLHNLATCYYEMGDKDRAIPLVTDVLQKRRKVLRAGHPNIAISAGTLACWKSMKEKSEGEGSEEEGSEEEGSEEERSEEEESEEKGSEEEGSEEEESEEEGREEDERMEDDMTPDQPVQVQSSSPAAQEVGPRLSLRKRRRINY